MAELSYEASDEASENELLERSLSVWRGWSSIREDFTPIPLDIHTASSIGQYDCVRTLIARGEVEIDRKNIGGWTPLMYACYIGHDHIVNLLIDAGCNVNLKNQRGQTPLMLAASCGNESVGRFLLRKGAELEAADRNGWTALFHATYSGHQNFVSFLLDQRANMDAVEPSTGLTPFMEAAIEGHEIIVQLFLQHGVNVNAKAYNGDTARTLALMYGYMKIVSLIDNHVLPHSSLRSEPGLGDYLSSSDEVDKRQRPQHQRGSRAKSKGPSIRDGPEAIARMIDRTRTADHMRYPQLMVPRGYMSFPQGEGEQAESLLSYRDVTSPINQEDYNLDSSGGKDSCDYNDDSNAFSKTGAITIKSSSSSSGGLIAALGLSRQNSADSDEFVLHDSGVHNSSQSEDNANAEPSSAEEGEEGKGDEGDECGSGSVPDVAAVEEEIAEEASQHEVAPDNLSKPEDEEDKELPSLPCEDALPEPVTRRGRESGVAFAGVFGDPVNDTQPFHIQFGDLVFCDVLGQAVTDTADVPSSGLDPSTSTTPQELYSDNHLLDRGRMFDPSCVGSGEPVAELPSGNLAGCGPFGAAPSPLAPPHMQRRSSCQARLSRLSVVDREGNSQNKDMKHRRRSTNSPPTFHREYGGRGQDLGSGTGRVTCLSDIPTNPGPGYPLSSAVRSSASSQLPPIESSEGGEQLHGGGQVPVAAVAPTCLPPSYPSLTPHPSSAFVPTGPPPPPSLPHKHPNPEISSASDGNPTLPTTTTTITTAADASHQSDRPVSRREVGQNTRDRLSELVRQFPGDESGGSGHCDLAALLEQIGVGKYAALFAEQDVDLQVFLSLTDNDLKEIGIKLFGPRKKMTNAIARWHSQAPAARSSLEQAYADRLEGEMQEMAIQLNQAYDSVEKLKAQVLQERQLRSVTESCLMEERMGWQRAHHTLLDMHQVCRDINDAVSKIGSLQAEVKQRLGQTPGNHHHHHHHHPSTAALPATPNDLRTLSSEQLLRLCDQYLFDLRQNSGSLARNMECIVSNPPPSTPALHDGSHVHHQDFP